MATKKQIAVKILKEAKVSLVAGRDQWICYAINYSVGGHNTHVPVKTLLTGWIESALGDMDGRIGCSHTYRTWISTHHPEFSKLDPREGRIQWVEWMIDNVDHILKEANELKSN